MVVGFHGLHNEQGSKINIVVALSPCNFIKTSFVAPERITVLLQLLWERKQQWLFFCYETFVFARKWGQIFKENY